MNRFRFASVACVAALVAFSPVRAAERLPHTFKVVALAPDGSRVAAVESVESADEIKPALESLVIRRADGGATVRVLPCGLRTACTFSSPAWSPDSKRLAFVVRERTSATREIYLANADGSHPRRLLSFAGTLNGLRFARDGRTLAVLATAGAHKEIGATQAGAPIVGEIGAQPDEQRIAVVSLGGGPLRFISPPDLFVYEYDWAPSGNFVGTGAHGNGDNNWWIAHLYAFDTNGTASELFAPSNAQMQLAAPRVSPDGKLVAFIGGIMSDFGLTGGDVYVLRLDDPNHAVADITPALPATATSLAWSCTRDTLLFSTLRNGRAGISTLDFPALANAAPSNASAAPGLRAFSSPPRELWSDQVAISTGDEGDGEFALACDRPQTIAVERQTFERGPELAVGPIGSWRDVTHGNADLPAEARAQSVTWTNEGFTVQGWLLAPPHVDAEKRYPMIVDVHGGPAGATLPRFIGRGAVRDFLRHGYFVFLPNPRGSFGQGERFTLANVKDFGGGDLRDILTGIDAVEKVAPVDDRRLGVFGGSYGGFMTMWTVTQTQRFKAGVAVAGISNWISYYGENGIDEWMIPFFGASAYDDPAVYRKSSPIEFIKNVKTPTAAFVGERDVECPAAQSLEFWHALQTLGVPTSLVIFAAEGHHIRAPAHRKELTQRTLAWFDRFLR